MNYRELLSRRGKVPASKGGAPKGDISHLLFVTARPGIQMLWAVLTAATLIYSLARSGPKNPWMIALLVGSFVVVFLGNHFFPFEEYHPYYFFLLMCACQVLISSLVYLTGNRTSLLGFLFFTVPIFAAAYYGYPGTFLVTCFTAAARFIPFMKGNISSLEAMSLALTAAAYFITGLLACYVVEGEKLYARESLEFRRLLEISRDREREISDIYNLSRKFSYTLDLDTILKTTAALARKTHPSGGSLVFLVEDGRPALKAALGTLPFSDLRLVRPPENDKWFAKLAGGNNVIAENVSLDWLPLPPRAAGQRSDVAAVPLFVGGDVSGYLMCFSPAPRAFRESHLDTLSTLASQAAVAVEKAHLYSRTLADKTKVETILSALRDGLIVTDAEGVLVQSNPVADRMLNFDGSAVGKKLLPLLESSIVQAEIGDYKTGEALEAALGGKAIFGEVTICGEPRVTLQSHFIPLKDHLGAVAGAVLFLHDITELKRVDEMKSNFVSNVSHELRTPLTSISGFVSLLLAGRAGGLTASQEKYLSIVKKETANLTKLIEDILDLSRLRSQGKVIGNEKVNIAEVVDSSFNHLKSAAREKRIDVELKVPEDLPPASADPARVGQVVTNILENAIRFTPGGGRVEIAAEQNGPVVQVQVSDNGVGIPPSAIPHIFDRFFRARSGDSEDKGGFGLGLAISREIVESQGGNIWVESEPGRGSTFYFTVPLYH